MDPVDYVVSLTLNEIINKAVEICFQPKSPEHGTQELCCVTDKNIRFVDVISNEPNSVAEGSASSYKQNVIWYPKCEAIAYHPDTEVKYIRLKWFDTYISAKSIIIDDSSLINDLPFHSWNDRSKYMECLQKTLRDYMRDISDVRKRLIINIDEILRSMNKEKKLEWIVRCLAYSSHPTTSETHVLVNWADTYFPAYLVKDENADFKEIPTEPWNNKIETLYDMTLFVPTVAWMPLTSFYVQDTHGQYVNRSSETSSASTVNAKNTRKRKSLRLNPMRPKKRKSFVIDSD